MMNIFQYLDYYIQQQNTSLNASHDKNQILRNVLSTDEYQIYEQIQRSDRERLLRFS